MLQALGIEPAAWPVWLNVLTVVVSILVIAKGAGWLVEGAARLGRKMGVSELVIGLTIVAFGTSAPELGVTLSAALNGHADISVGNVVGSNIFNLGFILGICALIRPLRTSPVVVWRDGVILVGITVLLTLLVAPDLQVDLTDGIILASLLALYLLYLFQSREAPVESEVEEVLDTEPHVPRDLALLVVGLAAVLFGSQVMVGSASEVARAAGISEWVIGVTIVAAGTSAPELATSLTAAMRGSSDLGVGALIGSDIFNMLGVLGVAGIAAPMQVDPMARYSLIALVAMVVMVVAFMRTGWRISRLEGALLLLVASARWVMDFTLRGAA